MADEFRRRGRLKYLGVGFEIRAGHADQQPQPSPSCSSLWDIDAQRGIDLVSERFLDANLQIDQARRMKDLERENTRLRRRVADPSLEKQVLADVASGRSAVTRSGAPAESSTSTGARSATCPWCRPTRMR